MKPIRSDAADLALAITTIAAIAAAGSIANATIPDSNKVFTACMLNNIGTVSAD